MALLPLRLQNSLLILLDKKVQAFACLVREYSHRNTSFQVKCFFFYFTLFTYAEREREREMGGLVHELIAYFDGQKL